MSEAGIDQKPFRVVAKPLFHKISDYPSRERSAEQKEGSFKVVVDARTIMKRLGLQDALIDQVGDYTDRLKPFLELTYGRPMTADEMEEPHEGRGYYHRLPEDTVYVKGIGSPLLAKGFPSSSRELIVDKFLDGRVGAEARMMGTIALGPALLEFVNASVVFAEMVKRHGWINLSQATEAGVTIPIGVASFPELSARMQELLQETIAATRSQKEKDYFSWEGNKHLGAVALRVPSTERIGYLHDSLGSEKKQALAKSSVEAETAATAGRTLRQLLEMGIVYPRVSAHGQNLYNRGLLAQADNGDLVFLGDYTGKAERGSLIYDELARLDDRINLVPFPYPRKAFGIGFEAIEIAQRNFWEQFLGGDNLIAHPDAIKQLPRLMPLLRQQVNLAAAFLTEEKLNSSAWDQIAEQRKTALATYDNFGAVDYLNTNIHRRLSPRGVAAFKGGTDTNTFGVHTMLTFLQTGDASVLAKDPALKPMIMLTDAIFAISDSSKRDALLERIGELQRKGDDRLFGKGNESDLAFIVDQIRAGRYDRAERTIKVLGIPFVRSFVHRRSVQQISQREEDLIDQAS